jgi:hypothetical protein
VTRPPSCQARDRDAGEKSGRRLVHCQLPFPNMVKPQGEQSNPERRYGRGSTVDRRVPPRAWFMGGGSPVMTMARDKAGLDFYTEVESAFKESMAENLADAVARDPWQHHRVWSLAVRRSREFVFEGRRPIWRERATVQRLRKAVEGIIWRVGPECLCPRAWTQGRWAAQLSSEGGGLVVENVGRPGKMAQVLVFFIFFFYLHLSFPSFSFLFLFIFEFQIFYTQTCFTYLNTNTRISL